MHVRVTMVSSVWALSCAFLATVSAHGAMVSPLSRNAVDASEVGCDRATDHCSPKAVGNGCVNHTHPNMPCNNGHTTHPPIRLAHMYLIADPYLMIADIACGCVTGQASFWYSQGCFIGCPTCDHLSGRRQTDLCNLGMNATLPDYARSVNKNATRFSELDIYQWLRGIYACCGNATGGDDGVASGKCGAIGGNHTTGAGGNEGGPVNSKIGDCSAVSTNDGVP